MEVLHKYVRKNDAFAKVSGALTQGIDTPNQRKTWPPRKERVEEEPEEEPEEDEEDSE